LKDELARTLDKLFKRTTKKKVTMNDKIKGQRHSHQVFESSIWKMGLAQIDLEDINYIVKMLRKFFKDN
jgi:hypothetical protein